MLILVLGASVCFILGLLIIFNKDAIARAEKALNRVILNTQSMDKHSRLMGIFLLVFALVLMAVAVSLKR
jgi:hypothetical protein